MPRIRTIKPEFPLSESMGRVSRDARLLFILLWTQADDAGRLRASPILLANTLLPYDSDAFARIPEWLGELREEGCVRLYEVAGNHYLEIVKWSDHQRIDHPSPSKLPSYEESLANVREEPRKAREDSRAIREDSGVSAGARADRDREWKGPGMERDLLSGTSAEGEIRKGSRNVPSKNSLPSEPDTGPRSGVDFDAVAARVKAKAAAADAGILTPDGQIKRRTNGKRNVPVPLAEALTEVE